MASDNTFTFACPHCGQHLEAEYGMVGMKFDCPACGKPFEVPEIGNVSCEEGISRASDESSHPVGTSDEAETKPVNCNRIVIKRGLLKKRADRGGLDDPRSNPPINPPIVTVIRKRERFRDKCKKGLKALGIGLAVLLLLVGIGVMTKSSSEHAAVAASIECLLNFVERPTDRRSQVLYKSLDSCPEDFRDAAKGFLASARKTSDDLISSKAMVAGQAFLGLLFGAASENDPQGGVEVGLQLGDLLCEAAKRDATRKWKQEIEAKLTHLIEVAEKYGIDPNRLENALMGRMR